MDLAPKTAIVESGIEEEVPVELVEIGDVLVIKPVLHFQ